MAEAYRVEDSNGDVKEMIGWPAGMKEPHDIPTGDTDLNCLCPCCGDVGGFSRTRPKLRCVNMDCRVATFGIFDRDRYHDGDTGQ